MQGNTLRKSERLKSEKSINGLFETGKILSVYPVRLVYSFTLSDENIVKAGFAVPKKNFRHAVDRNLLKRRMRESYRLNKNLLKTGSAITEIMFVYQGQTVLDSETIERCIAELLKKLALKISAA